MLTFTHHGDSLLVANEGEPSDDFTVDPEGSVAVIDVRKARVTDIWPLGTKDRIAENAQLGRLNVDPQRH